MTVKTSRFDAIIIGGSHAGLSAALTLYRANHSCLIFDSGEPRNASSTKMRLTSGWEDKNPQELRDASRAELEASGLVELVSRRVRSAQEGVDGSFEVVDDQGEKWTGSKILLAIGIQEEYPDVEGYAENYGTLIYYCMFCFGYERRGSSHAGLLAVGVLSNGVHAITNAKDAQKFANLVTIYTNGNSSLAAELSDKSIEGIEIDDREVKRVGKNEDGTQLVVEFATGEQQTLAFLVHKPALEIDTTLAQQLGCEWAPDAGIKVTPPFGSTSVNGVFAAGDCCSPLRMIPNALTTGSFAGLGIARQLPRRLG